MKRIYLAFWLGFFSCQSATKNNDFVSLEDESIVIDVSEAQSSYSRFKFWSDGNSKYLYAFDALNSKIDIIDWNNKSFKETLVFPDVPEMIGFTVSEFHIVNPDSIFLGDPLGRLYLIDSKGSFLDKIIVNEYVDEDYAFSFSNNTDNFLLSGSDIIFRIMHKKFKPSEKSLYTYPFMAKINMKEDSAIRYFGSFPEALQNSNEYVFNDHKLGFHLGHDEKVMVSFRNSEVIQVYDQIENKLELPFRSELLSQRGNNSSKFGDESELEKMIKNGFYHNILSDPNQSLYYRVVVPNQDFKDINNKTNSAAHRPFSIQVLDKDFNLLKESIWANDYKEFSFLNLFVTDEGIFIPSPNKDEDILEFKKLRI